MNKEEGAAEFGALIILFFLSALAAGFAMFFQASIRYFNNNSIQFNERAGADKLLLEIVASFQPLKDYEYDDENNPLLLNLQNEYYDYGLSISDISSGYHLDFLPDRDLLDEKLKDFLFINGTPQDYFTFRNTHGISTDKENWKEFLKEDAYKACTSYGWIHKTQTNSFAFSIASTSHKTKNIDALFPLVNEMPLMNVNMVPPEIITPLIMRQAFGISKPEEKNNNLINRLLQGPVILSDISSFLEISNNHALFAYLGTKTSFWKIIFIYKPGMYVEAVLAAIPKKGGGIQEIAQYKLLDRSIKYEK